MSDEVSERAPLGEPTASGRRVVVAVAAGVAVVIAYFALGMPGMDHGGATVEHPAEEHPSP